MAASRSLLQSDPTQYTPAGYTSQSPNAASYTSCYTTVYNIPVSQCAGNGFEATVTQQSMTDYCASACNACNGCAGINVAMTGTAPNGQRYRTCGLFGSGSTIKVNYPPASGFPYYCYIRNQYIPSPPPAPPPPGIVVNSGSCKFSNLAGAPPATCQVMLQDKQVLAFGTCGPLAAAMVTSGATATALNDPSGKQVAYSDSNYGQPCSYGACACACAWRALHQHLLTVSAASLQRRTLRPRRARTPSWRCAGAPPDARAPRPG